MPAKCFATVEAASAMASRKVSCSAQFSHRIFWSVTLPPEWMYALPALDAQPMDSCFSAPP